VLAGEEDKSGLRRFAITVVQLTDPALLWYVFKTLIILSPMTAYQWLNCS
jgi:hypothetical protein